LYAVPSDSRGLHPGVSADSCSAASETSQGVDLQLARGLNGLAVNFEAGAKPEELKWTGTKKFNEAPHPTRLGDVDMLGVLTALKETGFEGPMRPDHGRMIWGETGRAGYGLYDRALGATYLQGLWEGLGGASS